MPMLLRVLARPLLSAVFIGQGVESLLNPESAAETARPALDGLRKLPGPTSGPVPVEAERAVTFARVNAAVQVGAGGLLAAGKLPRIASAALAVTVIPGRIGAHMFWAEDDAERRARQRRDFWADLSLVGGLLIAAADTAGQPSLGWRSRRAGRRMSEAVAAALPTGSGSEVGAKLAHGAQVGAQRSRELVGAAMETALEKTAPLVDSLRERGEEITDITRERGAELADSARRLARSVS